MFLVSHVVPQKTNCLQTQRSQGTRIRLITLFEHLIKWVKLQFVLTYESFYNRTLTGKVLGLKTIAAVWKEPSLFFSFFLLDNYVSGTSLESRVCCVFSFVFSVTHRNGDMDIVFWRFKIQSPSFTGAAPLPPVRCARLNGWTRASNKSSCWESTVICIKLYFPMNEIIFEIYFSH